jgi:hypothetical protein
MTVAFDPAAWLGCIRGMSGDRGQLAVFPLHDVRHHASQRVPIAGEISFRFSRKQLSDGSSNGTINTTVVTHGYTPFFGEK